MVITAAHFAGQCLKLLEEVRRTHKEVVVTKRGKPIAKLVPFVPARTPVLGCMKGKVTILGDIVKPFARLK